MKVLSVLNISNFDDINSDSGFIFNYLLVNEIVKDKNEFAIVLPYGIAEIEKFKNNKIYYAEMGKTKYESRFCFDYPAFKKILMEYQPDCIFLNQCELATAIRALLISNSLNNIKIVSYCHYPAIHLDELNNPIFDYSLNDSNLCEAIIFDIFNSINNSDAFIIQSKFAKNLLLNMASKYNIKLNKKIHVISPPYDSYLYQKINMNRVLQNDNIIYNHRLYKSYGTDKLIEIIESNKNRKFLITNPMANRSKERAKFNHTPQEYADRLTKYNNVILVDGSKSRKLYKEYLKKGRIAIAPARKACVWSMSAIDCICTGIPVIAPNYASYVEFIPDYLRFETIGEANKLINRLFEDTRFLEKAILDSRAILDDISPTITYSKLKNILIRSNYNYE